MTKEKWVKIRNEEAEKTNFKYSVPEHWEHNKGAYLRYIKAMDEATEVYFMENGKIGVTK